MSFATFQTLPDHNLNIPEFRPAPIPAPPVYNTSEMIAPLVKLAQYLSPAERAKRKALIAKANFEFRQYSSGDATKMKNATWWHTLQLLKAKRQTEVAKARKLLMTEGGLSGLYSNRHKRDFPQQQVAAPTAPPTEVVDDTEDDVTQAENYVEPDDL